MYDEKIAIVLINDLLVWQKLNIVAFLSSSVAIEFPQTHGKNFVDASNRKYLPFIKHPMMIFKADSPEEMRKAFSKAKDRNLAVGIYTKPLFATKNEEQNLEIISRTEEGKHDLVGLMLFGNRKEVDKAIKGLKLHD